MNVRYAHLADFVTAGQSGKLVIVGVFDMVFLPPLPVPVAFPQCHLVFRLECSVSEGSRHAGRLRMKDADEETLREPDGKPLEWELPQIAFAPSSPGQPLAGHVIFGIGPGSIPIPPLGDYAFELRVDGERVGELPFHVVEPTEVPRG